MTATGIVTANLLRRAEDDFFDSLPPGREEVLDARADVAKKLRHRTLGLSIGGHVGDFEINRNLGVNQVMSGLRQIEQDFNPGGAACAAPPSPSALAGATIGTPAGFMFNDASSRVPFEATHPPMVFFPDFLVGGITPGGSYSVDEAEKRFGRTFDYQCPEIVHRPDAFYDLVRYAPGMNSPGKTRWP